MNTAWPDREHGWSNIIPQRVKVSLAQTAAVFDHFPLGGDLSLGLHSQAARFFDLGFGTFHGV
jgi:hypothetical protein